MVKLYIILLIITICPFLYGQENDTTIQMITYIETPPVFKGDLKSFIKANLRYPENAKQDSLEGTVYI